MDPMMAAMQQYMEGGGFGPMGGPGGPPGGQPGGQPAPGGMPGMPQPMGPPPDMPYGQAAPQDQILAHITSGQNHLQLALGMMDMATEGADRLASILRDLDSAVASMIGLNAPRGARPAGMSAYNPGMGIGGSTDVKPISLDMGGNEI